LRVMRPMERTSRESVSDIIATCYLPLIYGYFHTVNLIDKEAAEAEIARKERTIASRAKRQLAKKALEVGMVSADSPSPIKRVAAGFCRGMADKTDEDGEVVSTSKSIATRNRCQSQLMSLSKHAWDGAVWEKMKMEMMHELVTSGYTIKEVLSLS